MKRGLQFSAALLLLVGLLGAAHFSGFDPVEDTSNFITGAFAANTPENASRPGTVNETVVDSDLEENDTITVSNNNISEDNATETNSESGIEENSSEGSEGFSMNTSDTESSSYHHDWSSDDDSAGDSDSESSGTELSRSINFTFTKTSSIEPVEGDIPVEELYNHQNGTAKGLEKVQQPGRSVMFIYNGPEASSLVVLHGANSDSSSGSADWVIEGLPSDGEWVLRDDAEDWNSSGQENVSWEWSGETDGGVFKYLGPEISITIKPEFEGVTDWKIVSGSLEDPEYIDLKTDDATTIQNN